MTKVSVVLVCALAACNTTPRSSLAPSATQDPGAAVTASNAGGASQSWEDFERHGWNCRPAGPGVVVCSPPGEPLPVRAFPPDVPPDDRPPTVMLKRWRDGVFDANVLLIRPEIYNGQTCESTDKAYTWVALLGYFECAHRRGD